MAIPLRVLSGGAAQGLIEQVRAPFRAQTGFEIEAGFDAVGAMRSRLEAGESCDLVILTQALVDRLTHDGLVLRGATDVGEVPTGLAVNDSEAAPDVSTPAALGAALRSANGIYFPDPVLATAGIHFHKVLRHLGLAEETAARQRPAANGATAMRNMAKCQEAGLIGCTQVTEILSTPGVRLIGLLPKPFELVTTYTAAVCARAAHPEGARLLMQALASAELGPARQACGFL